MAEGAATEVAEGPELGIRVVDAGHESILVGGAPPRLRDIGTQHVIEVHERPAPDAGHEGVARCLDGRVQGDGERELLGLVGKLGDSGNHATGRDREVTRADAKACGGGVEVPQRRHGGVVVCEGLSLSHEHDARHALTKVVADMHDLVEDLVGRERAREA